MSSVVLVAAAERPCALWREDPTRLFAPQRFVSTLNISGGRDDGKRQGNSGWWQDAAKVGAVLALLGGSGNRLCVELAMGVEQGGRRGGRRDGRLPGRVQCHRCQAGESRLRRRIVSAALRVTSE